MKNKITITHCGINKEIPIPNDKTGFICSKCQKSFEINSKGIISEIPTLLEMNPYVLQNNQGIGTPCRRWNRGHEPYLISMPVKIQN